MNSPAWLVIASGLLFGYFFLRRQITKKIKDFESTPSSQVWVSITPEWEEIIKWCFPELKTNEEVCNFIENIEKEFHIERDWLFRQVISFVTTSDGVSGLDTIWSDNKKTFLEDLEIEGHVFGYNTLLYLQGKYPQNNVQSNIRIAPFRIAFDSNLPDGDPVPETTICEFPYGEVVWFFEELYRQAIRIPFGYEGVSKYVIKKFPNRIQTLLNESKFRYELDELDYETFGTGIINKEPVNPEKIGKKGIKWLNDKGIELFDQEVRSHVFKSQYCTMYIRPKFFSPPFSV